MFRARYDRKALGGGWRQAGVLASAALYGLENAPKTISEDHRRAEHLATKINELKPDDFHVDLDGMTNMVMVECLGRFTSIQLEKELEKNGILSFMYDEKRVRLVIHRCIDDEDIEHVIEVFRQL
uniref:Aromatic amino acid beta-eliminating lyase/threonine aldolase domain-containing protein n=1 Tax=Acrobeloides nanus TaxID=290746 RepID=A0A914E8E3_9BILA